MTNDNGIPSGDWYVVSRPTEDVATLRVLYAFLLRAYKATGMHMHLEAYIERMGEGNTFEDDFDVVTILDKSGKRPAEYRGCVGCGGRFKDKSFIETVRQSNGSDRHVKHWYCESCRDRQGVRRWYDVLGDGASGQPENLRFRVVKGRDNVRGTRAA